MDVGHISIASLSFDSSTGRDIVCGPSGPPLTPNSVAVIGQFKAVIEHVRHPSLSQYVECFRNKNGRLI